MLVNPAEVVTKQVIQEALACCKALAKFLLRCQAVGF